MTKLLDEAIAQARALPEDKQDHAAEALFALIAGDERRYRLTSEQVEDVKRIQRDLRTGATRLLSEEDMDGFWKSCGL
jgi:hypothetical protein